MSKTTRADDDRLLALLSLRAEGHSAGALSRLFGLRSSYIRTATNRVRTADEAYEGRILEGYWHG